jgi:flagellar basal body rod protein FlgB
MTAIATPVIEPLDAALSASALRHRVAVANVAHRDSEGYRRLAVRFEPAWGAAAPWPSDPSPRLSTTVVAEPPGADTSLERDLASMSSNALHYQALARSLGAYLSLLGAALDGGRA